MEQLFINIPTEKLHLCQMRKPHNVLSKGMVFYEVKTKINYKRKRYDIKILREYIVLKNNGEGKVITLCIHHCENYITSQRTDWKKKISRQFKNFTTPKELENLYYLIPLSAYLEPFTEGTRILNKERFDEIVTAMPFFKDNEEK